MTGIYFFFLSLFFPPLQLTCQAGSKVAMHQTTYLILQSCPRWAYCFKDHHNKDQLKSPGKVKADIASNKST